MKRWCATVGRRVHCADSVAASSISVAALLIAFAALLIAFE
jgi:hypothetical protein